MLATLGITVETRDVNRVMGDGGQVTGIELADGTQQATKAVFVARMPVPNNRLAKDLGCTVDEIGFVQVDEMAATHIDGVYAAGDLTSMQHQMSKAIAQGASAGAACEASLLFGT